MIMINILKSNTSNRFVFQLLVLIIVDSKREESIERWDEIRNSRERAIRVDNTGDVEHYSSSHSQGDTDMYRVIIYILLPVSYVHKSLEFNCFRNTFLSL